MTVPFYDQAVLIDRLTHAAHKNRKRIVFLVGSPLTAPELQHKPGVPNVDQMIELIRAELGGQPDTLRRFEATIIDPISHRYQKAFEYLIGARGQGAANAIVRKSVLMARADTPFSASGKDAHQLSDQDCDELEKNVEAWILPTGVRTLGKILVDHPKTFGTTVLTSNFDPLIEISIRKHGGSYYRTVLHRDGDLDQTTGDGCHVVHLHGYWVGRDTLHTSRQLQQNRPRLQQSLTRLLENAIVVVLAYGGWDDAFTKALMGAVSNDNANPELIWTFFNSDQATIERTQGQTLDLLSPGLDRGRVTLFSGIDCNNMLPRLREELSNETASSIVKMGGAISSRLVEIANLGNAERQFEIRIAITPEADVGSSVDSPPQTDVWVGRDHEMALLNDTLARIVVITGIGGQGKSALAAQYLKKRTEQKRALELWDWRDCREEGDRIQTQLISIIERLGKGQIESGKLENKNFDAILDIFFNTLANHTCLFVFDNVDHYIDLANMQPIGSLKKFIDAVVSRSHYSQFIFTCRPQLRYENPNVLGVSLTGLSLDEAQELFVKRNLPKRDYDLIPAAHELTTGHPLWLNIIAVQAGRLTGGLAEVLGNIKKGHGTLPENTLRSIWATLNDNQKQILRTMAELERPESENRLEQIMSTTTAWNRYAKALKTLKSLNLVVVKSGQDSPDLLDLHPLIRQFIRTEFGKKERERFITIILNFLDRMIGQYKELLGQKPSLSILEHWTQKAELELNRGHYQAAVATVHEVAYPLLARGFPEELVRVGKRIFREIDWSEACASYKEFDDVVDIIITTQIQLGDFDEANRLMEIYENAIPGKSAAYINLCDLRCHSYWFRGEFEKAIYWGEHGERLREQSNVDTRFSTKHNLALARRDSGKIDEALNYFVEGLPLEKILKAGKIDKEKGGAYYGNIGRCLQLKGKLDDALVVLRKSTKILESTDNSDSILNQGYARLWIGEILVEKGEFALAVVFLRAACELWKIASPPKARAVEEKLKNLLVNHPELVSINESDDWGPEAQVMRWINK